MVGERAGGHSSARITGLRVFQPAVQFGFGVGVGFKLMLICVPPAACTRSTLAIMSLAAGALSLFATDAILCRAVTFAAVATPAVLRRTLFREVSSSSLFKAPEKRWPEAPAPAPSRRARGSTATEMRG